MWGSKKLLMRERERDGFIVYCIQTPVVKLLYLFFMSWIECIFWYSNIHFKYNIYILIV